MSENVTKFGKKLSAKREKAANLVSEDYLTDEKIADAVGVAARTLIRWKSDEAFQSRVAEISKAFANRAMKHGLARRERRLALLNEHHDKLQQVIAERALDPDLAGIPGATTGLVTKTLKGIGKGDDYQVVAVYEVDTPTLREMRAIYDQVAEELGQKVGKHQIEYKPKTVQEMTDEELNAAIRGEDLPFEVLSSNESESGSPA